MNTKNKSAGESSASATPGRPNRAGERIQDVPKGAGSSIVHKSAQEISLGAEFQKITPANQLTRGLSKGLLSCLEK
jgi:hypothetical protein